MPDASAPRTAAEIRAWLVEKLSQAARIDPSEVRADEPLVGMGLDSMRFVVLVGELEDWLGVRFADNPLFDHPTIDALSAFLADRLARGETLIDPNRR
jgi:acyl carrier protein